MKLRAIWKENSPYSKLLLTVGTVLVSTTLLTVIASLIAAVSYGIPYEDLQYKLNDLDDPTGLSIMKIIQSASSIGVFILPALFLAFTFSDSWTGFLQLKNSSSIRTYLFVTLLMLAAVPFINLMAEWNSRLSLPAALHGLEEAMRALEDRAAEITEKFLKMNDASALAVNLLVIAVLPAVGEELFFRGLLQRIFTDWSRNKHVGIWVAAFVFSALHGQFYGFVPRMLLGAMFGYLFVWSGTLWIPILGHLVNNGAAVIATYSYQHGMLEFNPDEIGTGPVPIGLGILSAVACIGLLFLLKKETTKNNPTAEA